MADDKKRAVSALVLNELPMEKPTRGKTRYWIKRRDPITRYSKMLKSTIEGESVDQFVA